MSHYLGIDIGTSSVKALLIDRQQALVASADADLTVSRPHPGWSEQDPAHWMQACLDAVDKIRESHATALSGVRAIGLSGQMHGATLLDSADRVLRPAILWNDTRSYAEAAQMDADPLFRQVTGNIMFPGFTAPKLAWCRAHEPAVFEAVRSVLLPKDYVRFCLTGDKVSEMSDASGTGWLDVGQRNWSGELLDKTGLSVDVMPTLVEGDAPGGVLSTELTRRWGMSGPVVVAGGAGDNAAAACGLGVVSEGTAFVSLGTSGVLFAATDSFRAAPESAVHAFCHALHQTWHQMGVILSATDSLNWLAGLLKENPVLLADEAVAIAPSADAPVFLPYLSGERTPHNEPRAMGTWTGLSHHVDRAAMTRSVMTGVAFALRDNLQALGNAGTRIDRVIAVGGGAQSRGWLQIISDVLQVRVDCPSDASLGAAFGAARLAILATERDASAASVCVQPPQLAAIEPDPATRDLYAEQYARYRALYPAVAATG